MRSAPALACWLADPRARAASHADTLSAARWWQQRGEVRAFRDMLDAAAPRDTGAVIAAADTLFDAHKLFDALIERLVAGAARDPFFRPPFRAIEHDAQSGLLLIDDPRCPIQLSVLPLSDVARRKVAAGGAGAIGFPGTVGVYRFVRAGAARLSIWRAPAIGAQFDMAAPPSCIFGHEQTLRDGDRLVLDGRRTAFVIEHAAADIVLLQATVAAGRAPFAVDFDAATGRCLGARSTDEAGSRAQLIATLLRTLRRTDAFDAIAALTDDADFALRWHAMRELLALDTTRALPLLGRMAAHDAHRDVRQAADATLARVAACQG